MKKLTFGHREAQDAASDPSGNKAARRSKRASVRGIVAGALLGTAVFAGILPAMAQTEGAPEAGAQEPSGILPAMAQTEGTPEAGAQEPTALSQQEKRLVRRLARSEITKALDATGAITTAIANGDVDKVDGLDADDIARVAFAFTENASDGAGDVLSVPITAPVGGTLVAWASVGATDGGGSIDFSCSLRYVKGTLSGDFAGSERYLYAPEGGHHSCATSGGVQVEPGTYTVYFSVPTFTNNNQTLDAASLQVMFVPFDGTGARS